MLKLGTNPLLQILRDIDGNHLNLFLLDGFAQHGFAIVYNDALGAHCQIQVASL